MLLKSSLPLSRHDWMIPSALLVASMLQARGVLRALLALFPNLELAVAALLRLAIQRAQQLSQSAALKCADAADVAAAAVAPRWAAPALGLTSPAPPACYRQRSSGAGAGQICASAVEPKLRAPAPELQRRSPPRRQPSRDKRMVRFVRRLAGASTFVAPGASSQPCVRERLASIPENEEEVSLAAACSSLVRRSATRAHVYWLLADAYSCLS